MAAPATTWMRDGKIVFVKKSCKPPKNLCYGHCEGTPEDNRARAEIVRRQYGAKARARARTRAPRSNTHPFEHAFEHPLEQGLEKVLHDCEATGHMELLVSDGTSRLGGAVRATAARARTRARNC